MEAQQKFSESLERILRATDAVRSSIARITPEQAQQPLLDGGRSVKDVLGHLEWWDRWLLVTLPPVPNSASQRKPALFDQIPNNNHWAEEMNAKVLAYNTTRDYATLRADFEETCAALLARVSQLTDDDLYNPAGLSAQIGQPVAPLVLGIYEHYEEHEHELKRLNL